MATKRVVRSTKNFPQANRVAESATIKVVTVAKGSWLAFKAIASGIKSGAVKGWKA